MNLKTLYELKEVLDFCGYHDTIVEDMTNRGIDLESLEDKVNHEQKEIEENVYPNLHGTELLNKENISLLGEEILQYFEKTLEEWDKGIIDYDKNTNQLFHNEGKIFSSDVIAWYEGGRTTEDLVKEYSDEKEVEEDREHQILLLLGHAVHLGWNIKHDIGYEFVSNCEMYLKESVLAFDSYQHDTSKIILLDEVDDDGFPMIAICRENKDMGGNLLLNEITSIYEKEKLEQLLNRSYENDKTFYTNKKTEQYVKSRGLQLSKGLTYALSNYYTRASFNKSQVEQDLAKEKGCIEETYGMDLEEDLDEIEK